MRVNSRSFHRIWIFLTAINFLFSACTINKLEFKFSPPPTNVAVTAPFPAPRVEVIFNVEIPAQTAGQKSIYLDILDELTGLALNPYRYGMSMIDQTHYRVHVAVPPNSLIKYRYLREENPPEVEHTLSGSQVRYRMYFVTGPGTVTDFVSSWESTPSTREWGRVQGIITDTENQPIPNILVAAGGKQTFTSGGGYFLLEGLSPGIHNLVAYSIQGQFKPFQQGVQVAPGATTPATIQLLPHKLVKTTFYASLPPELVQEDQVFELRLVGDLYGLGNTFADLAGGINSTALQASKMVKNEDERYTITLELPEGFLFRYKYSLGDGFWNSELTDDSRFQIREIVPSETDKTVEDSPIQFALPEWGAITFKVDVPPDTPQEDILFIQFNPYGWTEPVPMIRLNEHTWQYKLFSPLHLLGSVYYRYCRNSQCESAGEQLDASGNPKERKFIPSPSPQTFKDKIDSWLWEEKLAPFSVDKNIPVEPARSQFFGGLEFQPGYHPSWLPFIPQALSDIKEMGANQVILTPTWTASSQNPPVLEPLLAHDFFWPDLINISKAAQSLGVKTAVYPQINFPESSQAWWEGIIDNAAWQRSWFDRYKLFVRNFAVLTEKSEAERL
ncbi:MAG: hypothetical protein IT308_06705, partial [Anaerolineaceae bacterium]|nr:hypothetical protein [Anaerolineaceae bacterium]